MKRNAIVFAALALILSGTMLFPAVSSAAEADTTTDPFGTNIESGAEISPTDETVTDEELYGDLDPELVQEYIEYMDYWDQLGQLDVYEDKGIDTFNNTPELTNATRKQIFLDLNNTIVPNYTKYVSGLKQIQPAHPKLASIHQKLIRGSYLQLEGMMLYKKAVSKTKINWTLYHQINPKIAASKELMYQAGAEMYEYSARFE